MYLIIKDVLQLFQHKSVTLAAGTAGLENIVSSANIMDAPDIPNWVKPGDLILTTAYIIKDNPELQERIVRELAAAGASGLGIKTKRFLPEIPSIITKTAEELGFPILDLPLDMALSEIMNPIISSIADRQSYVLHRTIELQTTLNRVAIQGEGLPSIVDCLSRLTQSPAVCYDINGQPVVHCVPEKLPGVQNEQLDEFAAFMRQKLDEPEKLQDLLAQTKVPYTQEISIKGYPCCITSFPVMSNNESFGHISILQTSKTFLEINCIALQQTCIVAALDFAKQKAIAQAQRLQTRNILECLLTSSTPASEISEMLANSSLKDARFFECWVIHVDESENVNIPVVLTRLYKTAQQFLTAAKPLSIVSEHANYIVALAASSTGFTDEPHLAVSLHETFRQMYRNLNISIGIGPIVNKAEDVRQSYRTARASLRIGHQLKGEGKLTFPYEIACYSVLEHSDATALLLQIYGPVIKTLLQENANLLQTLSTYLEYEQRLTETANALFIHRNTLTNRLEKIASLTDLDFENKEAMLCLRLALRHWRYHQK